MSRVTIRSIYELSISIKMPDGTNVVIEGSNKSDLKIAKDTEIFDFQWEYIEQELKNSDLIKKRLIYAVKIPKMSAMQEEDTKGCAQEHAIEKAKPSKKVSK